jgi:mono/diheme cytochrome c family protein
LRPQTSEDPGVKTVWDGVYTRTQAERGKSLYLEYCGSCHRDDLAGFSTVPPLAGDAFLKAWASRTAEALYTYVRSAMPPYQSTAISRQAYLDIVAFIFQSNGMPEGAVELTPDSAPLKATITKRDAH